MRNYEPLISVVIPTYNRAKIISRTISSVLQQTYKNFELLIIDDASTDNTEEIVRGIKDERLKYYRLQENSRGTKPRNMGINLSNGEFIAFLDSDDLWDQNKLEKQLEYILNHKDSNVMCFTNLIIKEGSLEKYSKNRSLKDNEDILDYILLGNNIVQTSTYMLSAELARKTLFDSSLKKHQDWDFCLRLRNNKVKFLFLPEYLTIWIQDSGVRITNSYTNDNISLNWFNSRKNDFSEKAKWAFSANFIAPILVSRKKFREAIKIISLAFIYRSIDLKNLTKVLLKCFLPKRAVREIKNISKKVRIK